MTVTLFDPRTGKPVVITVPDSRLTRNQLGHIGVRQTGVVTSVVSPAKGKVGHAVRSRALGSRPGRPCRRRASKHEELPRLMSTS